MSWESRYDEWKLATPPEYDYVFELNGTLDDVEATIEHEGNKLHGTLSVTFEDDDISYIELVGLTIEDANGEEHEMEDDDLVYYESRFQKDDCLYDKLLQDNQGNSDILVRVE
jgi:hypothetical protein